MIVKWVNKGLSDDWLLKLDITTWDQRGPMGALQRMTQEVPLARMLTKEVVRGSFCGEIVTFRLVFPSFHEINSVFHG